MVVPFFCKSVAKKVNRKSAPGILTHTLPRKGWIRLVEVVLAATLFMAYLSYVVSIAGPKETVYERTIGLKIAAEDVLLLLDNLPSGNTTFLRAHLTNGSYSAITDETAVILPDTYRFRYEIGGYESRGFPVQKEVLGQVYFVTVVNGTKAEPVAVKLWMWHRT